MRFATDDDHELDEQTLRGLDRLWAAILAEGERVVDWDLEAHSGSAAADGTACDATDPGLGAGGRAFLSSPT